MVKSSRKTVWTTMPALGSACVALFLACLSHAVRAGEGYALPPSLAAKRVELAGTVIKMERPEWVREPGARPMGFVTIHTAAGDIFAMRNDLSSVWALCKPGDAIVVEGVYPSDPASTPVKFLVSRILSCDGRPVW